MKVAVQWISSMAWLFASFSLGAKCLRATQLDISVGIYFVLAAFLGGIALHLASEAVFR